MKKWLSIVLALLMIAAVLPLGAAALPEEKQGEAPLNPNAVADVEEREKIDPNETVTFMIKLSDRPVAASVKDVNSQKAKDLTAVLKNRQDRILNDIKAVFPADAECNVRFSYTLLFNGFAVDAPYYMKEKIAAVPGVEKVFLEARYALPDDWDVEDTRLSTSVGLINADDAWNAGYTGAGSVIAILDTGCVVAHNAFSTAPSTQTMTTSKLTQALNNYNLQAEQKYDGTLSASTLYYSGKIPFRFNYDNGTTNVAHSYAGSDHGSHVSGIVAGNYSGSNYTGVAKDAQLVIMEVFNQSTGAEWAVLLAAMEDCAYLEVDALNMSLGADMGFSSEGEEVAYVYELLSQHGVNVAVAAGNSGSTSKQYYGSSYTYSLAMNPDNGVVSSPGTYFGSLCVAASTKSSSPQLCSFSSWGTTADLLIKPEVTAPGDSIYAPVDSSTSGATTSYGSKSGTSMATPHVAGAMGIVARYVKNTWPELSLEEQSEMVDRLLMCTSTPMMYSSGLPYSPRAQGAGVIDVYKAITTKAYITVDGCERPKLEIGDDPEKTGVFTMSFNIVNFGNTALTYSVTPYVESENATSTTLNGSTVYRMNCTPMNIKSNCTITCDSSVTVPANGTKTVTVTIALNSSIKNTLLSYYPHGAYVEGHIVLDGTTDLTVPFLGFLGNWNEASVFDRYTYIDQIKGENNFRYMSKQIVVGAKNGSSTLLFGANPYVTTNDWYADRCTISPNGDGYYEQIDSVVLALIRNAAVCGIKIYNEDDPSIVYYDEEVENMPKTWGYSSAAYGDSYYYYATDWMDFTKWAPDGLAEGTHLVFKMYAYLDNPGFTPDQNECCEIVLPMTVDSTAPLVTYWKLENGKLNMRIFDEHYAAWVGVYSNAACTNKITETALTGTERGAYTDIELSVGSNSTVYVKLGDYGYNTSEVYTLTGEGGSLTPVELEGITVSPETTVMIPDQYSQLTLTRDPAEAINFDVVWTSSNPAVATVAGSKSGASVASHAKGTAVITATATDRETGAVYTDSSTVTVKEGYTYEYFEPTNTVVTGEEYLIGYKSGSDVYLMMNYNPDPIGSNNYYYSYNSNYIAYGIKAILDENGNVTAVDDSTYDGAKLIHAEWIFEPNDSYYMIESAYQSGYYLRVYSSTNYTDLYAASGTSYATNWQWDSANNRLSYYLSSSSTKYASYLANAGSYQNFFQAGTSAASVQLYRHVQGTVIIDDGTHTVNFVDWDGSLISTQEVEDGAAAVAPEDPVREGYTFTGWDVDFSCVTSDLTVTAQYSVNSYTLTVYYNYASGAAAAAAYTAVYEYGAAYSVTSPVIAGYTADISVVEGVMGAGDVTVTVTYTADFTILLGDVDCNGRVDFADISLLYMYILGQAEITEQGALNADFDQNGAVEFSDISAIYMYILGL